MSTARVSRLAGAVGGAAAARVLQAGAAGRQRRRSFRTSSFPRRRRRPRHAGRARAARRRLAVAAGRRPAGRRAQLQAALKLSAAFYPAEAGLGYVALARRRIRTRRLRHFDRAVVANPRYAAGAGRPRRGAARDWRQRDMALESFEAAVVADPTLERACAAASRSCAFRGLQDDVAAARKAAEAGQAGRGARGVSARDRRIAGEPVPLSRAGRRRAARRATSTPRSSTRRRRRSSSRTDARTLVLLGEIYEAQGDRRTRGRGLRARRWRSSRTRRWQRTIDALRRARRFAAMPSEYQAIESVANRDARAAGGAPRRAARSPSQAGASVANAVVITDTREQLGRRRGSWRSPAPA